MMSDMEFPPPEKRETYPPDCTVCGGSVVPKRVTLTYPNREAPTKVRVIDGVPAGVCDQCGEKYLLHEVVVEIERLMAAPPTRQETVSVWEYAESA